MDKHSIYINNNSFFIYYPISNNSNVIKALLNGKTWERKLVEVFKKFIKPHHVVLDVGAYIGTHSILFSTLAEKVYAFEPQKLVGECLKKTISENDIQNISLYNIALHSKNGHQEFGTNNDGDASILQYRKKVFNENYFVRTKLLDNFNFSQVDFIKIDAEGSEFDILEGAEQTINEFRPVIVIEVWNNKLKKKKLFDWCADCDYTWAKINSENYLLLPNEFNYNL